MSNLMQRSVALVALLSMFALVDRVEAAAPIDDAGKSLVASPTAAKVPLARKAEPPPRISEMSAVVQPDGSIKWECNEVANPVRSRAAIAATRAPSAGAK